MFRTNKEKSSNGVNVIAGQHETDKATVAQNIDIDPNDPKANEAAMIIQHAFRKHQEHQEHHDNCHKFNSKV